MEAPLQANLPLESVSLRNLLRAAYGNKLFFIIFPILLMLPAYIGHQLVTPTFTARVKMYVKGIGTPEADFYRAIYAQDIIGDHSQLVTSNIVLNRVVEALKLNEIPGDYGKQYATPLKKFLMEKNIINNNSDGPIGYGEAKGMLAAGISVQGAGQSNMFFLKYSDFNPQRAVKVANSLSRSYIVFDLEQQIEELKIKYGEKYASVIQLENYIKDYEQYLDGRLMPDLEALGPASVKIVSQAVSADRDRQVPLYILLSFAFFTGIFMAAVFTAIVVYFDQTFRTPKDVVKHLNMPFIGSIPKRKKNNELVMSEDGLIRSSLKCVNSFQRLGDKICLLSKKENIKTILITAFQGNSDVSALIANLGIYLSRDAGKKVLIVDANLLNPMLANIFRIQDKTCCLLEALETEKALEDAVIKISNNLDLLLPQPASCRPIKLLDSPSMRNLIKGARDKYDIILIDCCSDLKRDTEPVILAALTDAVILVVNEGIDRFGDAQIVMGNLNQNGKKLIFSVLNNRQDDMPNILYKIS